MTQNMNEVLNQAINKISNIIKKSIDKKGNAGKPEVMPNENLETLLIKE